jgi:hypothetical protein
MITMRGREVRVDQRGINPLDQHGVIDDGRVRPEPSIRNWFHTTNTSNRSVQMYSMYEALARERMREQLEQSASRRLSANLASARLWRQLAAFSARRAARSSRRLAEVAAMEYQLVA